MYGSRRGTAPRGYSRLWTVPANGGSSKLISHQWGFDGSFSPNDKQIIIDKMDRWDGEWRAYRGGQNTPLILLDIKSQMETLLPFEEPTMDIQPTWLGDKIYFLSDRDWNMNVWSYDPKSKTLEQITQLKDTDVKWLGAGGNHQSLSMMAICTS